MKPFNAAVLMLALSLGSTAARAQEQAPVASPAAKDATTADVKPPPKRKPIKRRSVQQVIEPTPRIVSDAYRPTLTVRPPPPPPGAPTSTAPLRTNRCDAGGCFDTNGARYNGGVGPTLLSPQGQLCVKGAVTTQCF